MYYTQAGQEIEDAEMDNMRRAALDEDHEVIPIVVVMEDEPIHTAAQPFCSDMTCPCHADGELFNEYLEQPMHNGLLTALEAYRLFWKEGI